MPNLDLSIVKIMHGDTPVLRIMQGDTLVWSSGMDATINASLTNITSDATLPTIVVLNDSFTATLTANTGYIINEVTIAMGGEDITSTAYSDGVITIASVTGDVEITAVAWEIVDITSYTVRGHYINSDTNSSAYGKWRSGGAASNSCWVVPVSGGEKFKIVPNSGNRCDIAFLRTYSYSNGTIADFSGGVVPAAIRYNGTNIFTIPADTTYLYVARMYGSTSRIPDSVSKYSG